VQAAKALQEICKAYLANQLPVERHGDAKYAAGELQDLQIGPRTSGQITPLPFYNLFQHPRQFF
jgi:hypothetical protein